MLQLRPGMILQDRYELQEKLGEGGFGSVFAARQLSFERRVAIKVLHTEPNEELAERFLREAKICAAVQHPNVVEVHDFGEIEGAPFLVMEFLEGKDLDEIIRESRSANLSFCGPIISAVLDALDEMHHHEVLHRDLKPSNIFIAGFGGRRETVKVLDFGIATSLSSPDDRITKVGKIVGTPRYLAPETILDAQSSPASDIYQVGLVVYETLTGRPPYAESNQLFEILQSHLNDPLVIPEPFAGTPVGDWIARATAKAPEKRFASAAEALSAWNNAIATTSSAATVEMPVVDRERPTTEAIVFDAAFRSTIAQLPSNSGTTVPHTDVSGRDTEVVESAASQAAGPEPAVTERMNTQSPHALVWLVGGLAAALLAYGGWKLSAPDAETFDVALASEPSGATVILDGVERGATPLTLTLTIGELPYQLAFESPRCETEEVELLKARANVAVPLSCAPPEPSSEPAREAGTPIVVRADVDMGVDAGTAQAHKSDEELLPEDAPRVTGRSSDTVTIDELFDEAVLEFKDGNPARAENLMLRAIDQGCTTKCYLALGRGYMALGEVDRACKAFKKVGGILPRPCR